MRRNNQPVTQHEFRVPVDVTLMSITDPESRIVFANKAFSEVSGYTLDEMQGQAHNLVRHPDMPAEVFADMWATLKAGQSWTGLVKNRRKNGDYYWVRANVTPIKRNERQVGYISVRTRPAPGEVEVAERLYRRVREGKGKGRFDKGVLVRTGWLAWASMFKRLSVHWRLRATCVGAGVLPLCAALIAGSSDAVLAVVAVGAGLGTLIGSWILEATIANPLVRVQLQAQTVASGQPGPAMNLDRTDEIGMLERAVNQAGLNLMALLGDVAAQGSAATEGGSDRNHRDPGLTDAPEPDTDHAALSGANASRGQQGNDLVRTEIGQLVQAFSTMEYSLRMDKLTGIYNRTFLIEQFRVLKQNMLRDSSGKRPVHALLFIDLDNFKSINDGYGHDVGDDVLVTTAARLRQAVRTMDVVARYGGDEFYVLLRNVGLASNVSLVAEKIRAALEGGVETRHGIVCVGASIGWAVFPDDSDDLDTLLRMADQRMLEIKKNRKAMRGMEGRAQSADDLSQLYGLAWAPALISVTAALQQHVDAVVEQFYSHLSQLSGSRCLIESLSGPELQHLKSQQAHNLLALVSPELTEEDHRGIALRTGHTHSIMGLTQEDLIRSREILYAAICSRVDTVRHGDVLSILAQRWIRDVAWQAEAYQQLQTQRCAVLGNISQLVWQVESYIDLIDQIAVILGKHEEISGCSFGRPDHQGKFHWESVSGKNVEAYLADLAQAAIAPMMGNVPQAQGPTGRAWRSGKTEHCINFATDSRMVPWQAAALRQGFRSSVAIPLGQPGQAPVSILTMYSALPGGYAAPYQTAFIDQLKNLLAFAIARIENRTGSTHTVPYALRQRWASLLRSDALEMYYQPLLELKTGKVTNVEALARLRDGDRILAPGEFFPGLSSDDFVELYERGLGQALSQRNRWLEDGLDLNVSVNLPSSVLGDIRYFNITRQVLGDYDCPAPRLTLELLETDETPPERDVPGTLEKFKSLGVRLAEDDLGSGHSSLNRLREMPFDAIKIDRSIVTPAGQDPSDVLRFIYQLTRLGHSLGKSVIVEGVEDEALLEAVTILGVDFVQGYVIARPMPSQQITEWMKVNPRPGLSDPQRSRRMLAMLARLLIWEERLHVKLGDGPVSDQLEKEDKLSAAGQPTGFSEAALPDSASSASTFRMLFSEMESEFPFRSLDSEVRHAIIMAAFDHGPRSIEYELARGQLVADLSDTASCSTS